MIYCIGNSHANTFTGTPPGTTGVWNKKNNFASISLGPIIAYNFMTSHMGKTLSVLAESGFDKDKDYVLLAVGEVDCRVHIPRQVQLQNRDYKDVTKECVDRYFDAYLKLKKMGYNVVGYGSHPSTSSPGNDKYGSDMPIMGSPELRNNISIFWNDYMSSLCDENNIPFLKVIDKFLDDNDKTVMSNFIDYCHLNPDLLISFANERLKELQIQ